MKLEDCTKDELIYLLNRRCWSYISSASELEFDVLMYRSEETNKAMGREAEKEAEALAEYRENKTTKILGNGKEIYIRRGHPGTRHTVSQRLLGIRNQAR